MLLLMQVLGDLVVQGLLQTVLGGGSCWGVELLAGDHHLPATVCAD
jgi:hypothetical protein